MKKLTILILTVLISFSAFSQKEMYRKDGKSYIFVERDSSMFTWYEVNKETGTTKIIHSQEIETYGAQIPINKLGLFKDFKAVTGPRIHNTKVLRKFPFKIHQEEYELNFCWNKEANIYEVEVVKTKDKVINFWVGHVMLILYVFLIFYFPYRIMFTPLNKSEGGASSLGVLTLITFALAGSSFGFAFGVELFVGLGILSFLVGVVVVLFIMIGTRLIQDAIESVKESREEKILKIKD